MAYNVFKKTFRYLHDYGFKATMARIWDKLHDAEALHEKDFLLPDAIRREQKNHKFESEPLISILVPLYNTPEKLLREMIDSVCRQTYSNWELCLADGSDAEHTFVESIVKEFMNRDPRILYERLEKNGGISENTNACLRMAKGDYIALFDHDDLLTEDALFEVVSEINRGADVIYTDEDKVMVAGPFKKKRYLDAHYKPDLNMELLLNCNYICHFFVAKREVVEAAGNGFRKEFDGSQDYDFILRAVEKAEHVSHIPKILYHWRIHAASTAADPRAKMYCYDAGLRAIQAHLDRMGIDARAEMREHLGLYKVVYPVKGDSKVSIIIPNKDEVESLKKCIDSIYEKSTYRNFEIIIVENNSTSEEIFAYYRELEKNPEIKIVTYRDKFNYAKINNFGEQYASGDYILLLNNDTEVISEDWLERLLSSCQRPEIGAVGAKLLYPDDTVQHCGVYIGLGGIAGHSFVGAPHNHPGRYGRAICQQDLCAVTAACMMVKRSIYDQIKGMDENLEVAFNDVDFCLRIREAGYRVMLEPDARLHHFESKSRGTEDSPEKVERFEREKHYMGKRYGELIRKGDPNYNPNLTLIYSDFSKKRKTELDPCAKYVSEL